MARIPDETREAIADELRAGATSVRQIAAKHGVSASTVSTIGRDAGVAVAARSLTQNATDARMADYRARRAELKSLLVEDAHRLRALLWEPCTIYKFGGKDNTLNSVDLDSPDFEGKRNLMTSVGIAVDKMAVLDKSDAEMDQGKATGGLLERLVDSLEDRKTARETVATDGGTLDS